MSVKIIVLTSQQQYCAQWVLESTEVFPTSTLLRRSTPKKVRYCMHAPWESQSYLSLVLQTAKVVKIDRGSYRLNTIVRTKFQTQK